MSLVETILQKTEQLVTEILSHEPEYFLVEVKLKPTNNIKVYIDGDKGISIEKCVYFNRQLYKKIEEAHLFPAGDFSLEVSSPGVDKPLKMHRQYIKNIGRNVEVNFIDGSKKEGKLLQATNNDIILEQITGKVKKQETQQLVIPFSNIKTITVQIQF
jgi:ribosome maturation factor RimP